MIRKGPFKYVHYAGMRRNSLISMPTPRKRATRRTTRLPRPRRRLRRRLRQIVDPEAVNARRGDQRARVDAEGGREAIIRRGTFGFSPAPGTTPVYD